MNDLHPVALFRLSVLGPLVSRDRLERGELKRLIRELASRDYDMPGSARRNIGEKTIEAWFYAWRRGGIDALSPRPRSDRGQSRLPIEVQDVATVEPTFLSLASFSFCLASAKLVPQWRHAFTLGGIGALQ